MFEVIIDGEVYEITNVSYRKIHETFDGNKYNRISIFRKSGEFECKIRSPGDKEIFVFVSGSDDIEGRYIFDSCTFNQEREYLRPSTVIVRKKN